jgi:hypothetical protein
MSKAFTKESDAESDEHDHVAEEDSPDDGEAYPRGMSWVVHPFPAGSRPRVG